LTLPFSKDCRCDT